MSEMYWKPSKPTCPQKTTSTPSALLEQGERPAESRRQEVLEPSASGATSGWRSATISFARSSLAGVKRVPSG